MQALTLAPAGVAPAATRPFRPAGRALKLSVSGTYQGGGGGGASTTPRPAGQRPPGPRPSGPRPGGPYQGGGGRGSGPYQGGGGGGRGSGPYQGGGGGGGGRFQRGDRRQQPREPLVPMNENIRAPEVRVLAEDKSPLGVMPTGAALAEARAQGLDMIMVVPDAVPPVVRLMEFSKYNYELEKAAKEAKKKQREAVVETKELKLRPATDVHDYQVKVKSAVKFIGKGHRVKLSLQFRGREMEFQQLGREMFARFVDDVGGEVPVAVEQAPQMQGRQMSMVLGPPKKEPGMP